MIRWYQSINAPYFACLILNIYCSTKLKRFEAELPKHCIFGWLCDIFQPVKQSCVVWSLVLSCHWRRICPYKLHKWQMPMAYGSKRTNVSQNGLPKLSNVFVCILAISACKKTDPACANCFGAVASLGWRRNQMLRIRREGRDVANYDGSHVQPFSKDVNYATHEWFKEQRSLRSTKKLISHTSLLIPIWPGYPSLLATFRWEGLWNDRIFSSSKTPACGPRLFESLV